MSPVSVGLSTHLATHTRADDFWSTCGVLMRIYIPPVSGVRLQASAEYKSRRFRWSGTKHALRVRKEMSANRVAGRHVTLTR